MLRDAHFVAEGSVRNGASWLGACYAKPGTNLAPRGSYDQFPFNYNGKKYFGCTSDDVQLRFTTAEATDMWCPVNYMIPGPCSVNYMIPACMMI